MTLRELASYIARKEGRRHEASIGDCREIIAIIRKLLGTNFAIMVRQAPKPEEEK
jgi:hypothetical protein